MKKPRRVHLQCSLGWMTLRYLSISKVSREQLRRRAELKNKICLIHLQPSFLGFNSEIKNFSGLRGEGNKKEKDK